MAGRQHQNETFTIPENAILIDLREKSDYEAGHIPGALWFTTASLREEIRRIARFNSTILLYCSNGRRSGQAAEMLRSRGYENARSIGGINIYEGRLEPALTVRELREKKGLSQAALARMIGIRQPTVAAYESGKANPGPAVCEMIRRMLSVTVRFPEKGKDGEARDTPRAGKAVRQRRNMTIRELRKACGLTQKQFAESVGICAGSVAAYESGKTKPGPETLRKIREVYKVSISGTRAEKPQGGGGKT